jgi:Ni,Fe-hydrogenase I large subunit
MIGANFYLSTGVGGVKGGATFTKQNNTSITTEGGVEVLRIAHSFDPCIACAIH